MAAAPRWKVYSSDGEYLASCKYPLHAAMIVGAHSDGTVRDGHRAKDIVWNEGAEEFPASESWDSAEAVILRRAQSRRR